MSSPPQRRVTFKGIPIGTVKGRIRSALGKMWKALQESTGLLTNILPEIGSRHLASCAVGAAVDNVAGTDRN